MTYQELKTWAKAHRDQLNTITVCLIIGTVGIWLLWDGFLAGTGGTTESRTLTNWSQWVVSFPYAIACLLGHWWWPWRGNTVPTNTWRASANFVILAFLVGWDVWNALSGTSHQLLWARRPEIWILLGYPAGHYFWGQRSTEPMTKAKS
jgi:hypothetical protein